MLESHFYNIRKAILKEVKAASKNLKIAVYWFTNHELFDLIYQKQREGVQCEIIIHNDYINNRDSGLPFQKFINAGGKLFFSDEENPMHNKFCIIDNKILINGSYNWTYYAEQKNKENILIIKEEDQVIQAFIGEFSNLVSQMHPLLQIVPLSKFEIDENNLLRNRDYLAHDLIYQAKEISNPTLVDFAFELAPQNLSIQKIANNLDLIKRSFLKSNISVSIENDCVIPLALKGSSIPATFSIITRTSYDNQTKTETNIVIGESDKSSKNKKLTNMILDGIPAKPKGKAEIKFTFSIDIEGLITIEKMALDNGKKVTFTESAKWLLE